MDKEKDNSNIEEKVTISDLAEKAATMKQEEPKPKKRIGLGIMATILVLLLVGGALAIGYLWGDNTTKSASSNSSTTNNTTEPNAAEEVELTDATLKKDINSKIAWLLLKPGSNKNVPDGEEEFIAEFNYLNPVNDVFGNTMSDDFKLSIVLNALLRFFSEVHINITPEEYQVAKTLLEQDRSTYAGMTPAEKPVDNIIRDSVTTLSADVVSKYYYDLFGENLAHHTLKNKERCNTIYYSGETNSYISFPSFGCGGTSAGFDYLNREKYTINGNTVYVYYRAGSNNPAGGLSNDLLFQNGEIISEAIDMAQPDSIDKLKIDMKNNPSKYSHYRLVFKKNDKGTYSFRRAEKIE